MSEQIEWRDARIDTPPRGLHVVLKNFGTVWFEDKRFRTSRVNPDALDGRWELPLERYYLWTYIDDYERSLAAIPERKY